MKNTSKRLAMGCGALVLGLALVGGGSVYAWRQSAAKAAIEAREAQELAAEQAVSPVLKKLQDAANAPDYDIDKTIRVVHEIDAAVTGKATLEDYLAYMATQDYRGVAPEVLKSRTEIVRIVGQLQAGQAEEAQRQALWASTAQLLLAAGSLVTADADASVGGGVAVGWDGQQARQLLQDWRKTQDAQRELIHERGRLEGELFDAMTAYTEVYYRYVDEWDQLSVLRDRGQLAALNSDWPAAQSAAQAAIQKAPHEREAHLLLAQSLIAQDRPETDEQVEALLTDYIDEHPGDTAPALLLLGVHHMARGRTDQARLALQQSAAYYPRQAESLTDMLDPYRMRPYLRRSREGGTLVQQHKARMLGAGYYSPDLQMAKMNFADGNREAGAAKVLDHFARRRAQQQWDLVLSDIEFCHELLGPDFWQIFPEQSYLDLQASPAMMGSSLKLAINNRSARSLHNATLVLVLHLTDMVAGDYEPVHAQTVPVVPPHAITPFGSVDIKIDLAGKAKTVTDIVAQRAILITDEAVLWVDTSEFKQEELQQLAEQRRQAKVAQRDFEPPAVQRFPQFASRVDGLVDEVVSAGSMELESTYGADAVLVKLPRELALLQPLFRLRYGGQEFSASDNLIDGDHIALRFDSVANFDDATQQRQDVELVLASPFGDVVFRWTPAGEIAWRVQQVER